MGKPRHPFRWATVLRAGVAIVLLTVLAAVLGGCASPAQVTILITSHADGQRIVGSRAVTLTGTLAGATVTAFGVTLNGNAVAGASHTASSFSAPLTLADGDNTVEVSATSAGGTATATLTLTYPFLALQDFEPASVVIGQPDFTSYAEVLAASGMGLTVGNPVLVGGVLYVPDYDHSRVLGFLGGIPTTNGASADFVLGQPDFTTATPSMAADGMFEPQSVASAGGKLFVDSYQNSRVLVWNTLPTTTQAPADLVVGQADFGTGTKACSASGLHTPEDVFARGDTLLVADSNNNRVLVYHGLPTASGATPDLVLGQADLTHCAVNDDNQDGADDPAPTARTFDYPVGVWTDGTQLLVADSGNHRVLIWTSFPTSDFQPADLVLGQATMTAHASGAGPAGLNYPSFLASNGNQLFVADGNNNRVLIFDAIPTTSGASADRVLGQSDFVHVSPNDDDQNGSADATPSARTFSMPEGFLVTDDALVVTDLFNARLLVFRP